jgi:hypothetical protein
MKIEKFVDEKEKALDILRRGLILEDYDEAKYLFKLSDWVLFSIIHKIKKITEKHVQKNIRKKILKIRGEM